MANGKKGKKGGRWLGIGIAAIIASGMLDLNIPLVAMGALMVFGIGKLVSIMATPLDTTTHNREDVARMAAEKAAAEQAAAEAARKAQEEAARRAREEASKIPLTGDPTADEVITKGQEMIRTIRRENAAIPDEVLSAQMEDLCSRCEQIFRSISDAPSKAPQVRKFMNYYLPTTLKMLANYRTMQNRGVSVQEMRGARDTTVRGMNMILTACQKQIDNLHRENMMDISTDIDVLEQMLKRDGYTESEFGGIHDAIPAEPRTAMEAQMRASSVPVMDFPVQENSEPESVRPKTHAAE